MSDAEDTDLALYTRVAERAAGTVIAGYSTSFRLASRLLGPRVRTPVRNVYALVRVADEIVDGPATSAGLARDEAEVALTALEDETLRAVGSGFSSNLVVHAFARTARACGIGDDLVRPFFASMRTDLTVADHDRASHDAYVYGSAEVVGLMCLRVFVSAGSARSVAADPRLVDAARRLGAAFQDVNFLRDAHHDRAVLGRDYLGVGGGADRARVLDRIEADLAAAAAVIPELPGDCRAAVTVAHDLFAALAARLRDAPPEQRVRVPDAQKAVIAGRVLLHLPRRGARS